MTTHVIRGGRGSGKTSMLIQLSCEKQIPILVANRFAEDDLYRRARELGYKNLPKPFTVHDAFEGRKLTGYHGGILIDDADWVLKRIFDNVDIQAMTFTDTFDLDKANDAYDLCMKNLLINKDSIDKLIKGE